MCTKFASNHYEILQHFELDTGKKFDCLHPDIVAENLEEEVVFH